MSRSIKISLLIGGILVVLTGVLMILVKTLVTPEKVRETLVPLAEKSLHRKVTLGKIEIGILSGLSLKDLHVQQKASTDDLVTLGSMDLHYQLLPLLAGKIVIDQVKFIQPKIVIIKRPDGSFNFSDFFSGKVETANKTPSTTPTNGISASSETALNLLVNEVVISGGEVLFIDASKGGQSPTHYVANQFSFHARHIVLGKSFPIEISAALSGTNLAVTAQVIGQVTLAGKIGDGTQLLQNASLRLKDVQADFTGIKGGISGDIDYDGRQVKAENLQLNLGEQQAQLSFKAANQSGGLISGDFQLSADTLNMNTFIPIPEGGAAKPGKAGPHEADGGIAKQAVAEEVGPFVLPIEIQGTIAVKTILYRQLTLEKAKVDLQIKDNHLQISRFAGGLAGGEMVAAADIDLGVKGLSYHGQMDLTSMSPATLMSGLFPDAQLSITGLMQSNNTFSGHGTNHDKLLTALLVNGQTKLKKGRVTGSSLLKQLAGFLGNSDLEALNFDTLQADYDLRDRVVHLTGMMDSSTIRLQPVGTVGLDGPLDLNLNARLAPGIMANMGGDSILQQALTDEGGWGVLPMKLQGTISNPQYSLDTKALQNQAVDKVKQEVQRQLLNKIAPGQGSGDQSKSLFDKTLNKLFGN